MEQDEPSKRKGLELVWPGKSPSTNNRFELLLITATSNKQKGEDGFDLK